MEVLRPEVQWIDGMCYRINQQDAGQDFVDDQPFDIGDYEDDSSAIDVKECRFGGFETEMAVPGELLKYVIGKRGETKRRLESETKTQIKIPRLGEKGNIVIQGPERQSVCSAASRIDLLVAGCRLRQPFTHFLSIPVTAANIVQSFLAFKEDVLENCSGDRGVSSSLFQDPQKLHLTLGTLVLLTEEEIAKASEILQQSKAEINSRFLAGKSVDVEVCGLEYMNDDPNDVDVLYVQIKPRHDSNVVQELADWIVDRFRTSGFMHENYDRVKLHVTAINSLFRRESTAADTMKQARGHKERESFDASNILRLFGDRSLGCCCLSEIQLNARYTTDKTTGYYNATDILKL